MLFYTITNPLKSGDEYLGTDREFDKDIAKAYKLLSWNNAKLYLNRAKQHHPEKVNLDIEPHDSVIKKFSGTEGQDRQNYTDTQDRENYTVE